MRRGAGTGALGLTLCLRWLFASWLRDGGCSGLEHQKERIVCGQATEKNGTAICHLLSDELKSCVFAFFSFFSPLGPPFSHPRAMHVQPAPV